VASGRNWPIASFAYEPPRFSAGGLTKALLALAVGARPTIELSTRAQRRGRAFATGRRSALSPALRWRQVAIALLRADRRLRAMAHTLVKGASLNVTTEDEVIWELADVLESKFLEIEEGAKRTIKLLRQLRISAFVSHRGMSATGSVTGRSAAVPATSGLSPIHRNLAKAVALRRAVDSDVT
jgi:hypothetical protein